MDDAVAERPALLILNGWAGLFEQRVMIVGETAHETEVLRWLR
jgi:hypothetical protein